MKTIILDTNKEIRDSIRGVAVSIGFSDNSKLLCKMARGEKVFRIKFNKTHFCFDVKYAGYECIGWYNLKRGYYSDAAVIGDNVIVRGRIFLSAGVLKNACVG